MTDRVQGVVTRQGNDVSDLINRHAEAHGCDAVGLLAGLISESDLDEHAEWIGAWPDWSEGLGQQTVLYASVGDHTPTATNLAVVRDYYWQPENAIAEAARQYGGYYRQYGDYFEAWSRYNGGPTMVYADNPNAANIRRGWDAAQAYRVPDGDVPRHYDPDTPDEYQVQDWTCSVRTATWLLRSIGVDVTAGDMQDRMVAAGLVTPASGLLDGSGTALAAWLSATFGIRASAYYPAEWSEVLDYAGDVPIGLGGQAWNHWVAVRGWTADGALELMNPAPGWMGVSTILTRAQWDRLGPFAVIYLAVRATPEEDDLSAEERDELDRLKSFEASIYADTLTPIAATLDAALAVKGAKGWGKVAEVRQSLKQNAGV